MRLQLVSIFRATYFPAFDGMDGLLIKVTGMMGRVNETMAVVDSEARVFGVSGLRVIDSSSFRFTPPGHTQAATCE
jgi:hypothetical protein